MINVSSYLLFGPWKVVFFYCLGCLFFGFGLSLSHGGSIAGQVIYKGTLPQTIEYKVTRDQEFCGTKRTYTPIGIDPTSKGVQGAAVSIRSTPLLKDSRQPQTSILMNQNCMFLPHILTTRVKDILEIRNNDPILHNTHIRRGKKTFINVALVVDGLPIRKHLKKSGVMKVECNAHKFMQAYILAFDHPFYSLTNPSGNFQISEVPPGQHKLDVWHEFLGHLTVPVEVPTKGNTSITIEFPTP